MKYSGCPLFVLLVAGMILSACSPKAGHQYGAPAATATPGLAKVESDPEPTPVAPAVLPTTHLPASDEKEEGASVLEIPYTEENPLTNVEEVQEILDHLQKREVAWFSRPGWYRFTIHSPSGRDYTRTEYILTHVINNDRGCLEQFAYFEQDGKILPYAIHLEDGTFGLISHTVEGTFQVRSTLPAEETPPCDLGNGTSIGFGTADDDFILHDEASQFQKASSHQVAGIKQDYRAWVERIDGRQTLILVYDGTYEDPSLRGTILDPTTGVLHQVARNLRFHYIDLETGLQVRFDEEFYLEDGQLVSGDDVGLLYSYEYLETMPEEFEQVFEDVATQLKAMLDKIKDSNP